MSTPPPNVQFTEEMTGKQVDLNLVRKMLEQYRDATSNVAQLQLAKRLFPIRDTLTRINDQIGSDIEVGYEMLPQLPSTPEDEERLNLWQQWLSDYEAIEDVICAIREGVSLNRWGRISNRREV